MQNPLDQLKRSKTLLQQLLKNIGFNIPIEVNVSFINPEFTLYQAPLNKPIIYFSQLNSYMKKLNKLPSKLTSSHRELAETLISINPPIPVFHHIDMTKCKKEFFVLNLILF
ncbi:hypothetical protein QE429_001743 [Bacillus sp. SORGH_AS 510]|nr:hypothetical protein [Bacillus sp. SORGH_AS_0510]